ncbi:MAG: hypothetical protein SF069_09825 [Phycisphaerae bacterium]|nr:hypothetical protein [Phycisphaerae bacterium]
MSASPEHPIAFESASPRCPRCGYDLRGAVELRCPECGHAFTAEELARGDLRLNAPLLSDATDWRRPLSLLAAAAADALHAITRPRFALRELTLSGTPSGPARMLIGAALVSAIANIVACTVAIERYIGSSWPAAFRTACLIWTPLMISHAAIVALSGAWCVRRIIAVRHAPAGAVRPALVWAGALMLLQTLTFDGMVLVRPDLAVSTTCLHSGFAAAYSLLACALAAKDRRSLLFITAIHLLAAFVAPQLWRLKPADGLAPPMWIYGV